LGGPTGPTGPAGTTTFTGLDEPTNSNRGYDEAALPAIAQLVVTANGTDGYQFNSHYSGDNPTIYALGGATIAFKLSGLSSHPFRLQEDTGAGFANIESGLIHIDTDGTVNVDVNAQEQTSGTVYWNVPVTAASNGYRYQCSIHTASMVGTITHKSLSSI